MSTRRCPLARRIHLDLRHVVAMRAPRAPLAEKPEQRARPTAAPSRKSTVVSHRDGLFSPCDASSGSARSLAGCRCSGQQGGGRLFRTARLLFSASAPLPPPSTLFRDAPPPVTLPPELLPVTRERLAAAGLTPARAGSATAPVGCVLYQRTFDSSLRRLRPFSAHDEVVRALPRAWSSMILRSGHLARYADMRPLCVLFV